MIRFSFIEFEWNSWNGWYLTLIAIDCKNWKATRYLFNLSFSKHFIEVDLFFLSLINYNFKNER